MFVYCIDKVNTAVYGLFMKGNYKIKEKTGFELALVATVEFIVVAGGFLVCLSLFYL